MVSIRNKYRIDIGTTINEYWMEKIPGDFPKLGYGIHHIFGDDGEDLDNSKLILGLICSSMTEKEFYDIAYLTTLISDIEHVVQYGTNEHSHGWRNVMAYVRVFPQETEVIDLLDSTEGGIIPSIPTSEILQLLKDWKKFLEEFYGRAWGIPLDWVKPEHLEEAKKLQLPNN